MAETGTGLNDSSLNLTPTIRHEQLPQILVATKTFLVEVPARWISLFFMLYGAAFYFFVIYFTSNSNDINQTKMLDGVGSMSDAQQYVFFYPLLETLKTSGFTDFTVDAASIGLPFLYALVFLISGFSIWLFRTRVWRHTVHP
jgi:hypothetical protein